MPETETRRERRAKRRREREERRKQRAAIRGPEPPPVTLQPNNDPLRTYSATKQPLEGHPLRDLWRASPAGFLVCGGPSLKTLDVSPLERRGVPTLAINNVAGLVRVKAMTFADPPEKFHYGIFLDPGMMKLVPTSKLGKRVRAKNPDGTFSITQYRVRDCPNVWGYSRDNAWVPEDFLKRESATWGCSGEWPKKTGNAKILFTFFLGLRLCHYLGLRHVFLVGCDFKMLAGKEGGYAFGQSRTKEAADGNNNSYRIAAKMCRELQPHFLAQNYKVYNCNPDSGLDAFPHVPYEAALGVFSDFPDEPFDLSGYYDKPGGDDRGTE